MKQLLIVTDLDGTLLDHDDYSFAEAADALARVRQQGIPLILASSKTGPEIVHIQRQLEISHPFICENGAAIHTPARSGFAVEAMAPPREQVLAVLEELREACGYRFAGFADTPVAEIAAMTGLKFADALRAADRDFSEPLLWQDSDERLQQFRAQLADRGLTATQGGRFLSVAGDCNKAVALQRLRLRFGGAARTRIIALGDSPNDESMLAAADIAVVIRSDRSDSVNPAGAGKIIRTGERGPRGWQAAVCALLDKETSTTGEN